jgi:hypothetical protein
MSSGRFLHSRHARSRRKDLFQRQGRQIIRLIRRFRRLPDMRDHPLDGPALPPRRRFTTDHVKTLGPRWPNWRRSDRPELVRDEHGQRVLTVTASMHVERVKQPPRVRQTSA